MDKNQKNKVVVLACSGIGKTYGALARDTAQELAECVRPGTVILTCLARLVMDDPEARLILSGNPVITIDGCPRDCAKRTVESTGKKVAEACQVVRFYAAHKDLKPEGLAQLNEAGRKLARIAAEELAATVDKLAAESDR